MLHIRIRSSVKGPSSGMADCGEGTRPMVERREFNVRFEGLCDNLLDTDRV